MNILSLKKLFLFGTLLYIPFQSLAWGMLGHRVVGQVAERYLSKKAKGEVRNILGTSPTRWISILRYMTFLS